MLARADHPPVAQGSGQVAPGHDRWSPARCAGRTVSQERLPCLHRFDRWLAAAFDDPREVLADPAAAAQQAAAFRRWAADPANRSDPGRPRRGPAKVHPRLVNDDLRSVAELLAFMAAHQPEAAPCPRPSRGAVDGRHRRPRRLLDAAGLQDRRIRELLNDGQLRR